MSFRASENESRNPALKNKEFNMKKTIKVEGMMCAHCEKHVKDALEKIDGVIEASANHEKGEVSLKLSKEVAPSEFEKAITDEGYKFIG